MKITNAEGQNALKALGNLIVDRVPVGSAMKMREMVRLLSAKAEDIEAERMKLLNEHGEQKDGKLKTGKTGEVIFKDKAAQEAFAAGFTDLMNAEFECPAVLTVADLGSVQVSTETVIMLGKLLDEDTSKP